MNINYHVDSSLEEEVRNVKNLEEIMLALNYSKNILISGKRCKLIEIDYYIDSNYMVYSQTR